MTRAANSEFRRPLGLDEIEGGEVRRTVEADADERAALARRFDLMAIESLAARLRVRQLSGRPLVRVEGRLIADVVQRCVVTLEPLPVHLEVDIAETFGPEGYRDADEAEGAEVPEVFDDNAIDLGELVAQLLLLSLDPYPRSSDADSLQRAGADDVAGERSRPFAGLGALMEKQRK